MCRQLSLDPLSARAERCVTERGARTGLALFWKMNTNKSNASSNLVPRISILFGILTGKFPRGHFNRGGNSPDFGVIWSNDMSVFCTLQANDHDLSGENANLKFYCPLISLKAGVLYYCALLCSFSVQWILTIEQYNSNHCPANISAEIHKLSRTTSDINFCPNCGQFKSCPQVRSRPLSGPSKSTPIGPFKTVETRLNVLMTLLAWATTEDAK